MWNVKGRRGLYLDLLLPSVHSRDDSTFHFQNLLLQLLQTLHRQSIRYWFSPWACLRLLASLPKLTLPPWCLTCCHISPFSVICFKASKFLSFERNAGGRVVTAHFSTLPALMTGERNKHSSCRRHRPRRLHLLSAVLIVSFTLFIMAIYYLFFTNIFSNIYCLLCQIHWNARDAFIIYNINLA